MKIVIVIDSWNKGNGCIVSTHRLVNELQKRGHEITLVSTSGEEALKFNGPFYALPGFYLPGVKESMKNMGFLFAKGEKKTLKKAFAGADLVQIQFPYFVARNAVKVANKMNIPVIGACHIQSQNMTGAMGKDSKAMDWFFNSWFNFELFNRVNAIHCPSEFAADLIKTKGSNSHFRVISNGIPEKFVSIDNLTRPDLFGDKFVLMNVGRHAMEKKQEILIDAVLQSKYKDNIKLLICGKGETSERLIQRGKELPVEPLIRYISEEEKLLFFNTSDMYVHSSAVELESLSILEAIGTGLPSLIEDSPLSATSQFAPDDRFLFKTVEELSVKIDYWYENKESLKKIKEQILLNAGKYRIENSINAMEELYDDAIKTHNGAIGLLPKGQKIIPGDKVINLEPVVSKEINLKESSNTSESVLGKLGS
ncbi:MAG: glycosyltransferase [Bacteroidales bacterium]|nr:glycosyltransferase [Bacteroidales bacterium]